MPAWGQMTYRLPKALLLTTGADKGRGTVSDGAVMALYHLNRYGIPLRFESRDILWDTTRLKNYNLLFVPTAPGYHDHIPSVALHRMSEEEMNILVSWIHNGGTLVADLHTGRDTPQGEDRIALYGGLLPPAWPLGNCLNRPVFEKNLKGFALISHSGDTIKPAFTEDFWHPVAEDLPPDAKVTAFWKKNGEQYPAWFTIGCEKGKWIVLPSFKMLHPAEDGGWTPGKNLKYIYEDIIASFRENIAYPLGIWAWKNAYEAAYAQTFDDGGNLEQYQRIIRFIRHYNLPTTFFVTAGVGQTIYDLLLGEPLIDLQGHSYSHPDFRKLDYAQTRYEIAANAFRMKKKLAGFRFPYVSNSFYGMLILDENGVKYETSIAAPHKGFIRGSVIPYNIPVFKNDFYRTLDVLEISQIYRSDWYFYQAVLQENEPYSEQRQQADAERFFSYLTEYFDTYVKVHNGAMVFLGHPMYSGYSDITIKPLYRFLDRLSKENVWITTPEQMADWWNARMQTDIEVTELKNKVKLRFNKLPPKEGFTLILPEEPKRVKMQGSFRLVKKDGDYLLVIKKLKGDEMVLEFK